MKLFIAAIAIALATSTAFAGQICKRDSDGNYYCCHSDGFGCN